MRALADTDAAKDRERASYFDGSPSDTVLVGIGDQLRGAYREMTGAEQPEHLVDLAQKLEALIAGGSAGR